MPRTQEEEALSKALADQLGRARQEIKEAQSHMKMAAALLSKSLRQGTRDQSQARATNSTVARLLAHSQIMSTIAGDLQDVEEAE